MQVLSICPSDLLCILHTLSSHKQSTRILFCNSQYWKQCLCIRGVTRHFSAIFLVTKMPKCKLWSWKMKQIFAFGTRTGWSNCSDTTRSELWDQFERRGHKKHLWSLSFLDPFLYIYGATQLLNTKPFIVYEWTLSLHPSCVCLSVYNPAVSNGSVPVIKPGSPCSSTRKEKVKATSSIN